MYILKIKDAYTGKILEASTSSLEDIWTIYWAFTHSVQNIDNDVMMSVIDSSGLFYDLTKGLNCDNTTSHEWIIYKKDINYMIDRVKTLAKFNSALA